MALEQQRLSPAERANLVAYLDRELNEAESRAIATKLSLSPTARREVEALEKTWELLEQLPRPKASEDFTERTLTEVRQLDAAGRPARERVRDDRRPAARGRRSGSARRRSPSVSATS